MGINKSDCEFHGKYSMQGAFNTVRRRGVRGAFALQAVDFLADEGFMHRLAVAYD